MKELETKTTVGQKIPSVEQSSFLRSVMNRCLLEAREEGGNLDYRSEPMRFMLHGVPGAGKSQTLHWLRRFFEDV